MANLEGREVCHDRYRMLWELKVYSVPGSKMGVRRAASMAYQNAEDDIHSLNWPASEHVHNVWICSLEGREFIISTATV